MRRIAPTGQSTPAAIDAALQTTLRTVGERSSVAVGVCTALSGGIASVAVRHDLGVIPDTIRVVPWQDGSWYATAADRRLWTAQAVTFTVTATGSYDVIAEVR